MAIVPLPGQAESGDRHLVAPTSDGALVAVVDGLGHGSEAAEAAKIAVATLHEYREESVISLVRYCHERLKSTRGVVMSLASFNVKDNTVTWLSVGNVEGLLFRAHGEGTSPFEAILMRGGVVGYHLPLLQALMVPVFHDDILVLATDGIRADFSNGIRHTDPPQRIAESICAEHAKGNDDALVFVARYTGITP